MLPVFSLIDLSRTANTSVYLQISNQLMALIRKGSLRPGQRLPSTREMAADLTVHRRTVVQAYDELLSQGWLESHTGRGTFVAKNLPEVKPQPLETNHKHLQNPLKVAGFQFKEAAHLFRPVIIPNTPLHLDDGFPDPRLAPLEEISRAYRSQLLTGNSYTRLGYGDTQGSFWLRQELSQYLNHTRGLTTSPENILITRGTVMGLYLVCSTMIDKGEHVAITALSWSGAVMNLVEAGAQVHTIPTDENGIDVDALEAICKKNPLRLLYITSHHQYPTTVVLRADRRIKLLNLAEQYRFIIFEDDYDYDFHYETKPLMPLAGADQAGMVLYCGSLTKTISPAFRLGYLVGSENVIRSLARYRRIVDRQGDAMLENAVAELLHNGVIQRHLRKSLRIYRARRDLFCDLLTTNLKKYMEFQVPKGGMAVWSKFDAQLNLVNLAKKALQKGLYFSEGSGLNQSPFLNNGTRLGYASSNQNELEKSVDVLKLILDKQ